MKILTCLCLLMSQEQKDAMCGLLYCSGPLNFLHNAVNIQKPVHFVFSSVHYESRLLYLCFVVSDILIFLL